MPPAKKPAARRTTRTARPTRAKTASKSTGPITRKEVEAQVARFDKALGEAGVALQKMRDDFGKGAKSAYKDVATALKTLQRDAQKATRVVIKDIDQLRSSVGTATASSSRTAAKAPARSTRRSTAAKTSSRSASKTTAAKAPARSSAKAPARSATKRTSTRSSRTASK